MPRLAVDQFGRIYETSPDRDDGLGYGCAPTPVTEGDLTLGSAYLKSQSQRSADLVKLQRDNRAVEALEENERRISEMNRLKAERKEMAEIGMHQDPKMRDAILREALSRECECEYSTSMSGNVMTANGQSGWAGMSRDQQVIHHVTMGMGSNLAYAVDPDEEQAHREKVKAEMIMRLGARR